MIAKINTSEIADILKNKQCMGCGICTVPLTKGCHANKIDYKFSADYEHWVPSSKDHQKEAGGHDIRLCPGAEVDMKSLAKEVFGRQPENPMLGEALKISYGFSKNKEVRKKAASGGLVTSLIEFLFDTSSIDVCYCSFGKSPHNGRGVLVRDKRELVDAMGSHYHPIAFGDGLSQLVNSNEKFAFVGLPCEVAGLRALLSEMPELKSRCVLVIGLFCGGINRFSGIETYLQKFKVDTSQIETADYRYGKWPGSILLRLSSGKKINVPRIKGNSRWNILKYMISFQGYWMLPRCRICPDQIADFADIAVGDPHLPEFKNKDTDGFSVAIARNNVGLNVLNNAEKSKKIYLKPMSAEDVIKSQGYTLENRRNATVYTKVAKVLMLTPPKITVYDELQNKSTFHQYIYAFVDLSKLTFLKGQWFSKFHLFFQIFEYLFLTLSPRIISKRLTKILSNK